MKQVRTVHHTLHPGSLTAVPIVCHHSRRLQYRDMVEGTVEPNQTTGQNPAPSKEENSEILQNNSDQRIGGRTGNPPPSQHQTKSTTKEIRSQNYQHPPHPPDPKTPTKLLPRNGRPKNTTVQSKYGMVLRRKLIHQSTGKNCRIFEEMNTTPGLHRNSKPLHNKPANSNLVTTNNHQNNHRQ